MMYHSAMRKYGGVAANDPAPLADSFRSDSIAVFQHDICSMDIPEEFYAADAVCTVMSWRAGYKKYTENSIAEGTTFGQYCASIDRVIRAIGKPGFVVTNRTFAGMLNADRLEGIHYCEFDSEDLCAVWNYGGDVPKDTDSLKRWVGQTWETVLDFCCGYGGIADFCRKAILTDINTTCIKTLVNKYKG